jgi:hypothetical protein
MTQGSLEEDYLQLKDKRVPLANENPAVLLLLEDMLLDLE